MTTSFPLLRLPYLVLMPILEQMALLDRIALSVLSKRARKFVKLLKMKCNHINLKLKDDRVEMKVLFDNSEELRVYMYIYKYRVDLRYGKNYFERIISWRPGTLTPMDYVLPIMDITHCKSIKTLTFPKESERTPEYNALIPLLIKLPKIDELIVEHITSYVFSPDSPFRDVLKIVFPVSSAINVSHNVQKPKYTREIFKGNFDAVSVSLYGSYIATFPLNDWRFTNAKTLKLDCSGFKVEDLNQYFKLWMKKKCNPKLEYLQVATRRELSIEEMNLLLKGLNAVQMPIRTDRTFRVLGNIKQFNSNDSKEEITSDFDITRADGRRATIRTSNRRTFCFYVWPESTDETTNLEANQSSFTRVFSRVSTFYNSCIERFK
ncbi:hypothetical protein CRE_28990 [Caenorhabditis remanei]|uniref:F-box domain-containing protein n=1 Tax=Caenorhabditis remanei TaxID=31234 RepID=E3N5D5_CAERE|nr:hypothetical protein CRE_28990 [Caenorhabditis remanei]